MAKSSNRVWGMFLLGIWLIIFGIMQFGMLNLDWLHPDKVMAGIAIAAGALLLINR